MTTGFGRAAIAMLLVAGSSLACGEAVRDADGAGGSGGSVSGLGGSATGLTGSGGTAGAAATELECAFTRTRGQPQDAPDSHVRLRFDVRERVLRYEAFSQPGLRELTLRRGYRYDADGRLTTQTVEDFVLLFSWRGDGLYDTHRNLVEWSACMTPSSCDWDISTRRLPAYDLWIKFAHTYENGALVRTVTESNPAVSDVYLSTQYQQDQHGRCVLIANSQEADDPESWSLTQFNYDDNYRLLAYQHTLKTQGVIHDGGVRYEYDSAGRLVLQERDGALGPSLPLHVQDGVPEFIYRIDYAIDGAITVDLLDFETNLFNDVVDRSGVPTPVAHTIWRLPAECGRLFAAMTLYRDARCSAFSAGVPSVIDLL